MSTFFISYTRADRRWAEWIAWVLESTGITTRIDFNDFRPGDNFMLAMDAAIKEADRIVAVLSPDYLDARYAPMEWAAALARDAESATSTLLPIRVRPCDLGGLLAQIVYLDLVGADEAEAQQRLVAQVKSATSSKNPLPRAKPPFPGQGSVSDDRARCAHESFQKDKAHSFTADEVKSVHPLRFGSLLRRGERQRSPTPEFVAAVAGRIADLAAKLDEIHADQRKREIIARRVSLPRMIAALRSAQAHAETRGFREQVGLDSLRVSAIGDALMEASALADAILSEHDMLAEKGELLIADASELNDRVEVVRRQVGR